MAVDHQDRLQASSLLERIEEDRRDAESAFARWRFLAGSDEMGAALEAIERDAAEYPNVRVTCRSRELRSYRRCPGEGPAVSRGGYRIWTESGHGRSTGGRERSLEIE